MGQGSTPIFEQCVHQAGWQETKAQDTKWCNDCVTVCLKFSMCLSHGSLELWENTCINTVSETILLINLSDRWVATCCIDGNAPNMRAKTNVKKEQSCKDCPKNGSGGLPLPIYKLFMLWAFGAKCYRQNDRSDRVIISVLSWTVEFHMQITRGYMCV